MEQSDSNSSDIYQELNKNIKFMEEHVVKLEKEDELERPKYRRQLQNQISKQIDPISE